MLLMAIALSEVADQSLPTQGIALAVVAVGITIAVYGAVAIIVKMDDIGLHLAQRESSGSQALGRGLVKGMPVVMSLLSSIGIAAMIWVGGGILVHGLEVFHFEALPHALHGAAEAVAHAAPVAQGLVEWVVTAIGSGVVGLVVGGAIVAILHVLRFKKAH